MAKDEAGCKSALRRMAKMSHSMVTIGPKLCDNCTRAVTLKQGEHVC